MIPKQITVGDIAYTVKLIDHMVDQTYMGRVDYDKQTITVSTKVNSYKLEQEEVQDSFWHELTHAILHDMRDSLCNDEVFVTNFSRRLSSAINSAKL